MNRELTNTKLLPQQAIIIHHDKAKRNWYLESRKIKAVKGKYSFLAPTPLSDDTLRDLAAHYAKSTGASMEFGGPIAEHLLYAVNKPGHNVVMWYRPAVRKRLNFEKGLRITGEPTVMLPATLYCVVNRSLYVFALMTDERPHAKTKLYKAPFFNIYPDGNVCLGTAKVGTVKARTFELEAERFEKAFYMAEQNGGASDNVCKTKLNILWSSLIKKKANSFPVKQELIQHPRHKNLEGFIKNIIDKNYRNGNQEEDEEDFDIEEEGDEAEIRI